MIVPAITLRGFSRQRHRSITDLPRLPALSEFCEFGLNLSVASRLSWNRHHYREAGDLMVQLHVERTIAASPERVFDWLADPTNLGRFSFGSQGRLGEGFVRARRGRSAGGHRGRRAEPKLLSVPTCELRPGEASRAPFGRRPHPSLR
jgi:hypothetical protein